MITARPRIRLVAAIVAITGGALALSLEPAPPTADAAEVARPLPRDGVALRAGETVDVSVLQHPELSRSVRISEDGSIEYPFLGRLEAAGRTAEALERAISSALAQQFSLRDVRVSVFRTAPPNGSVFVLGHVTRSGRHDLPSDKPLTLIQLIALAGGFSAEADTASVQILGGSEGGAETRTFDLSGLERAAESADTTLHDGDVIVIARAPEVAVLGQVNSPGTIPLRAGESRGILLVLARARGFTRLADRDEVLWIRAGTGAREARRIDVDAVLDGKAPEPQIEPGDVLYVTERMF